jgi:spoIIIJ-associated protein
MPPHERRIIHLALRDNPNVTTESVGEGDRRKVTIVPRRSQ